MGSSETHTPRKLADFDVIRRLGAGGMAEVFLAKKDGAEGTYKLLVLKRILPKHGSSERFRAMFAEEAMLATRLNHPNIVQVYDFQDYGPEGLLLSMEFVDGPDLRRLHRAARSKQARLPVYLAAWIVAEVAKGLHYAHERKDEGGRPLDIVHRDVSPQNILLSTDGSVKVADFGIATANLFRQDGGTLKGKTAYMSPEQANGLRVDRRSDIYSLGVVLHELLSGRPLHGDADGQELLEAVRAGHVEPPGLYVRGIPAELEAVVMKALSIERENRFSTAREMASAITRVLLEKRQLVDAQTLEAVIAEYAPRSGPKAVARPHPAASLRRASDAVNLELPPAFGTTTGELNTGESSGPELRERARAGREFRHVAVVGLRVYGRQAVEEAIGRSQTTRLLDQVRNTLNEIAYKHGTHWSWQDEDDTQGAGGPGLERARTVAGLTANPARATSDAADMALDVHEALAGACDGLPRTLSASICLVRGVAEGRRDARGHLTSYRLQEAAGHIVDYLGDLVPQGATWAAGGLYRVIRREYVWTELPALTLDPHVAGLARGSIRVYSLLRRLTREEERAQLAVAPRDLIGRNSELADLHAAYHQAVGHDPGRFVCRRVVGEIGVGKTALLSSFFAELPPDAKRLRVECSQHRSELPFAAAAQWLRELTGIGHDDSLEQAAEVLREPLEGLKHQRHAEQILQRMSELAVGRLSEAMDEADAALRRRLLTTGLRHLFARAAEDAPLVVMLDSLQWMDLPSLELLSAMIQRGGELPILLLLGSRPDERLGRFFEDIVTIELRGLSPTHQIRLVEAHLGADEGASTACADLIPRAAGNPFFLLEMVDALLERGVLELRTSESGRLVLLRNMPPEEMQAPLPSTLEQLIADRLSELPQPEHHIIDWLAVARGPLSPTDLAALAGDNSVDAVARLCARGLCDQSRHSVDVRHPLTRDVAYHSIDPDTRRLMHQRLGEHLMQLGESSGLEAALVARHLARGEHPEAAADYYLEAAAVARLSFQLQVAARYYVRALAILPAHDSRRLEPYSVLEDICRVQGRWQDRVTYLRALRACALEAGLGYWVALALLRHAQFEFDSGRLTRALHLAGLGQQCAEQASSARLRVRGATLTAEILGGLGQTHEALAALEKAEALVESGEVPARVRAELLRARATLVLRTGRLEESVHVCARSIALFRHTGARRDEGRAKYSLARALAMRGDYEDAIALAFETIRIDLSLGARFQLAKTLSHIAQCYARLGAFERAELYFERATEAHARYQDVDARHDSLVMWSELALERGELDQASDLLTRARHALESDERAYDSVRQGLAGTSLLRAQGSAARAAAQALETRKLAESKTYIALHFQAMALEAAARADLGERHDAILLATTALGALEALEGSDYAIESRALCIEAVTRVGLPTAGTLKERAAAYVRELNGRIRDPHLRASFQARKPVALLLT